MIRAHTRTSSSVIGDNLRPMNEREFYCKRHRIEWPAFKRVLEAMPIDRFDYRPHERSMSALELVWTLAQEMAGCLTMIDRGELHWAPPPAPSPREAVQALSANYVALDERVQWLTEEEWLGTSRLYVAGDVLMEQPLGAFLWYLFFDAIHHRGQLSTYIRPMGGKVPSIYGPSGDDPGR
jgi:uncharacterized damage-inducible protein DinB